MEMAMRSSYSGSSASDSGSSACSRVRTIKLTRRPPPSKLGFSIRGGSEHGTGFFITSVEPGSEAQVQGLMVGDQIIRVNGYLVEDATHREVLQLIQGHSTVTLKVKSVGMIPVKESPNDELTWRIVETESPTNSDISRTELDDTAFRIPNETRLTLKVPLKAKLGCGICKGPEWKPGVFVQFTKENSIARQAGLRPGDQIVQCNNFKFTPDTPFSEAVTVLKCSGALDLLVRKGAGMDLFPGESSGYNSSASSVAGDNPWPHRLSVVTEETPSQNQKLVNGSSRPHNGTSRTEYTNGCTVIHVNGEDTENRNKRAEICMVSQQLETKTTTVLVEVHHSEEDDVSNSQSESSTERLTNCSSVSSFTSSASSLSSAINQEIERRSKRAPLEAISKVHQTDKLIKSGLAQEKIYQHEQLMEEFKKAHKRMFANGEGIEKYEITNGKDSAKEPEELKPVETRRVDNKDVVDGETFKHKRMAAPPPPPPLPAPEVKAPTSTKKYPAPPPPSPPYCPTPDYDTTSLASDIVEVKTNGIRPKDAVEMQSLESFKLTNPTISMPKPPNTYFTKGRENGVEGGLPPTKDTSKPMVTIREYPANKERRSPTRFEFLQGQKDPLNSARDQPITSRLHSELTQTLSRSNLISKTESTAENGVNGHSKSTVVTISVGQNKQDMKQQPFYLFPNGNGTEKSGKALGSIITKPSQDKLKSHNGENANRNTVTFNFNTKDKEPKTTLIHPNGILKNGTNNNNHTNNNLVKVHTQQNLERIVPPKSIKFGGI